MIISTHTGDEKINKGSSHFRKLIKDEIICLLRRALTPYEIIETDDQAASNFSSKRGGKNIFKIFMCLFTSKIVCIPSYAFQY